MKALLKILLGAMLVFQAVAIAQEWELFGAAWFGTAPGAAKQAPLSDEARKGAEAALRQYHAIARHLYATAGDPRFTDRLPASERVAEELLSDVAYLQHNGLAQEGTLVRLDVLSARPLAADAVVLDTREYWVIRLLRAGDRQPVEPPRSQVFYGRYQVKKAGGSWRIEAWEQVAPPVELPDGGP